MPKNANASPPRARGCECVVARSLAFVRAGLAPPARTQQHLRLNERDRSPRHCGSSGSSSESLAGGSTAAFLAAGFCFAPGVAAVAQLGHFAGRAELPAADFAGAEVAVLPATRYLRIFSRRFLPMPRMASKSSTLLKAPYDLRICKILSAVAGPMPGTCCSSSDVAAFRLIGCSGGFFVAAKAPAASNRETSSHPRAANPERQRLDRSGAITARYCHSYVSKSITREHASQPGVDGAGIGAGSRQLGRTLPCASCSSTSPKSLAWSSIWARSPTTTICMFAESKYARAVASKSAGVSARTFSR